MNLYSLTANEIAPSRTKNNQYFFKGFQPSSPEEYFAIIPAAKSSKDGNNLTKELISIYVGHIPHIIRF
ncbi:hypothetical protein [Parapedobacter koreensis]|nr:hypothetical protein [Parapedobacter koreensis]